jgi:DNA-directed RNA polymerase specialized sigma subunit
MYALLEQSNERPPSAEEIAKELDMTVNDVKSMKNSGRHLSMDAPLVEGEILTYTMYCVLAISKPRQRTNPRIITYRNRTFIRNIDSQRG